MCVFTRVANLQSLTNIYNVNVIGAQLNIRQCLTTITRSSVTMNNELILANLQKSEEKVKPKEKMSKAMKAYLERSRAHEEFIKKQIGEFELGKRHLANIMGEDVQDFTQPDIDRAIEYLFPSGLFDAAARPMMRHPKDVYPNKKESEFDKTGRPFHSMFYTSKPNYYQALYDLVDVLNNLNAMENANIMQGLLPNPEDKLSTVGADWLSKAALEKMLIEDLHDAEYNHFIQTITRVADHPLSNKISESITKYRKKLVTLTQNIQLPPMEYDSNGRPFITVKNCMRKSARGEVIVWGEGSGNITINGKDITYFENIQCREQIIFPLMFTNMSDKVDIEATVTGGGPTGQSGAIRWGIAWGLRNFVPQAMLEKMRLAGLLTRDWRRRERKKWGQEGARRKFTWKKR